MAEHKYGLMRQLGLNDPVTVTLPAHVWAGFLSAYGSSEWSNSDTNAIMIEARDALFDPRWLKEREAELQRQHDTQHRIMSGMIPGFPSPDIPPDPEGLSGDGPGISDD